ncbi:MAG: CTP synthase [Candidatus Improbicoccus devescovinae]|nr:MAG: CTP synthase [Candidatus Improbicoccus devescovinae]
MSKFVFVTGGVVSGLGKGITAATLGCLLKHRGLKITAQKMDPYMNVDPGTMSPYQHGEVFVTEDGAETDLDIGHYERFIDENLSKYSNLTAGKVYWEILQKERRGEYLGHTVQVIPHVTNEIKKFVYYVSKRTNADVVITEVGGTVGDIEIQPFLEAIRQISTEIGYKNCLFIHVTLVPFVSGEYKSKPTQHSVKELRSMGINPSIIIARSHTSIGKSLRDKIALFCNVKPDCVIENITLDSLYYAPLMLEKAQFSDIVVRELDLNCRNINMSDWENMLNINKNLGLKEVKIAIIGKYVKLNDAYLSIVEALKHAAMSLNIIINIKFVDSENLVNSESDENFLSNCHGILVPGGFGNRGIEGMIRAAKYARINNIPYFGICLGMQIAVIEFARNVLNLSDANSSEFDQNSQNKIIDIMENQLRISQKGGTMRLGAYTCSIKEGTIMHRSYGILEISERHRHRYEFNNFYREQIEQNNMIISGIYPNEDLVEAIEIKDHKFFVGVQFHPEFKSRPNNAHPLFKEFVKISSAQI